MDAKNLVEEYAELYGSGTQNKIDIDQYESLRKWLEDKLQKRMSRPLFITKGSGGGQKYRLWWLVFDVLGNKNTPCYFYTEMESTAKYLIKHGHLPLQHWVDDKSPQLKYERIGR